MNQIPLNEIPLPFVAFGALFGLIQVAWYVAVIVFLFKIWMKVRNLPAR